MNNLEANRCLLCRRPRCKEACPVLTDVPSAISLYREGNIEEAAKLLFDNNPMTGITCQVCDWKKTCYGACILNSRKIPIRWYEMEQEISMEYLLNVRLSVPEHNGKKIAIVGAGPAGITAAIKLREKGFYITIYDDHQRLGGVLRYGIPPFRLNHSYVDAFERLFAQGGIVFKGNTKIGDDLTITSLRKENDAVLIAGGAWQPRKLDIPGEVDDRVIYAMEYLMSPDSWNLKGNVIVVGGGNVTMDAGRTAVRQGCNTTVYYRKTFENMPANINEVEDAKADGVKFVVFQVPVAIRREGEKRFATMRRCENVIDDNGKVRTKMIDGTDHDVEFDYMIVAISENVDYSVFGDNMPLSDRYGYPIVNENFETSIDGVYLCGDFLTGPTMVVKAVQSAKNAVAGILNRFE